MGILPALAGYVAERRGLEIIGPFMVISSVAMVALHEVIARRNARQDALAVVRLRAEEP